MRHIGLAFVILCAFIFPAVAQADTVTVSAVPTFTIVPSADTLTLNAGSTTFTTGVPVVIQIGTFSIGHSGTLVELVPFSFVDNIAINGITKSITVTGQDDVTLTVETIEINAIGPISFGSETLSIDAFAIGSPTLRELPVDLTGEITAASAVPEPGTFALLGSGVLGLAGMVRRKAQLT